MKNKHKMSDNVIGRIAQIVQGTLLLGTDAVDLMRQIELEVSESGDLEMTSEYVRSVQDMHKKLLDEADRLRDEKATNDSLIFRR
jgi:hypothetical protein